ncbi:phenylacetate--CoA ligase family protein [Streptomyces sp. NPDC001410]|uniref:phenylacetate--CoA ligase family protein n=1 Tax=Streptomyces sp. NPDC001410 TaxID=3364574 RepID=UPI0036B23ED8
MDLILVSLLMRTQARLRGHETWTRSELKAYQADALRRLRAHAYARSPFYRRFHAGLADTPLRDLPVLTKALLMEHFDELVTDRRVRLADLRAHVAAGTGQRYLDHYRVCATSGSSGHPALVLFDPVEWATFLASFGRLRGWAGVPIGLRNRLRTGSVASDLPWHMSVQGALTFTTLGPLMPTLRLGATEPLTRIAQRLEAWQPQILGGYPSILRMLADEQLAGRLHLTPRFVLSGSEVLTAEARRRIEEAWGPVLFEGYGTTEGGGGNAAECERHEGMHLFEDLIIAEIVDEDNHPVPPGEQGAKVLMTVLSSRTLPLIRYEIDDRLRLTGTTGTCGRPFALIHSIEGRTDEIMTLPAETGGETAVHPVLFHRLFDPLPINGWQVVQQPDHIRVLLSGARGATDSAALASAVADALTAHGAIAPRIDVLHVDTIPRTAAGKAPLIKAAQPASPGTGPAMAGEGRRESRGHHHPPDAGDGAHGACRPSGRDGRPLRGEGIHGPD